MAEQYQILCRRIRTRAAAERQCSRSEWFQTTHVWVVAVMPCGLLVRALGRTLQAASPVSLAQPALVTLTHRIAMFAGETFHQGSPKFLVKVESILALGWWQGAKRLRRGPARTLSRFIPAVGAYGCLNFSPYGGKLVCATDLVQKLCTAAISHCIAMDKTLHAPQTLGTSP